MMQNNPPNNPQQQPNYPNQNYDQSYIQHQLNQQLLMQQGVKINVLHIMAEAARRLGKHFGNVFFGWLVFIISFSVFWIALLYLMQLFMLAAMTSVAASGFTFATAFKLMLIMLAVFIVMISASMIFYFGFLSYISDLIELDSANYGNIFTGFQKILQIVGFVSIIVIPMIIISIAVALPFGMLSALGNYATGIQSAAPTSEYHPSEIVETQYKPYNPPQNPNQNNPYANSSSNFGRSDNAISNISAFFYSIIVLGVFLLYVSKLILVPNLLIAQDMTLKEAVAESWKKVSGNTFLHVFLLLILLGVIAFLINMFSVRHVAPAMITPGSKWSFIWYTVVNGLMVQVVFVYFIGCIAHTYNSLYPLDIKTDAFAYANKYSRRTHPKYLQPLQQQWQQPYSPGMQPIQNQPGVHPMNVQYQNNPANGYNPPTTDPFLPPNQAPNQQNSQQTSAQNNLQNTPNTDIPFNQKNKQGSGTNKDGTFKKQKIQYVSQPPYRSANTPNTQNQQPSPPQQASQTPATPQFKPPKPQTQNEYIHLNEEDFMPPKQKAHVTKFVDNLFEKDGYPTGKIVPVDAMRMMKDPHVKFIEVQFQDVNHAFSVIEQLPMFGRDQFTKEFVIRDSLSFSLSLPKIASNPVKLFFGGKDMTIQELWDAKEIITENMGKITRINRGKE